MAKRRTYFRIRRMAAAELLRLNADGHRVHAEAMQWAQATIEGIDDMGGRPPVTERQQIMKLLEEHAVDGQTPEQVAAVLGTSVKTMRDVLYRLRHQGQCAVVKRMGRCFYFPSEDAAAKQRPRPDRECRAVSGKVPAPVAASARPATAAPTRESQVQIIYPPNVTVVKYQTPRVLIDRFGADPETRVEVGFHAEWQALRAGGTKS